MAVCHYQVFLTVEIFCEHLVVMKQMNLKFYQYQHLALALIPTLVYMFSFYIYTFFRNDRYILQNLLKVTNIYDLQSIFSFHFDLYLSENENKTAFSPVLLPLTKLTTTHLLTKMVSLFHFSWKIQFLEYIFKTFSFRMNFLSITFLFLKFFFITENYNYFNCIIDLKIIW